MRQLIGEGAPYCSCAAFKGKAEFTVWPPIDVIFFQQYVFKAFLQVPPRIAIIVAQVNSHNIYIIGEVNAIGKLPLKHRTTLLQALTMAGGFTPVAARNRIVIFRNDDNGTDQIKLSASYDDIVLRGNSDQNLELKPGDTIVVPSEAMVLIP